MSVPASAVGIPVPAAVVLLVVGLSAVAVLLLLVRGLVPVAGGPAAAAHLGWVMAIGGVVVVPGAPSDGTSTSRVLPLWRCSESVIELLNLLHVELPHHVVHLQIRRHRQQEMFGRCSNFTQQDTFVVETSQELHMKSIREPYIP